MIYIITNGDERYVSTSKDYAEELAEALNESGFCDNKFEVKEEE